MHTPLLIRSSRLMRIAAIDRAASWWTLERDRKAQPGVRAALDLHVFEPPGDQAGKTFDQPQPGAALGRQLHAVAVVLDLEARLAAMARHREADSDRSALVAERILDRV